MDTEGEDHSQGDENVVESETEVLENICRVVDLMDESATENDGVHEVFVKSENPEEGQSMDGEQVILEEFALSADDESIQANSISLRSSYVENKIQCKVVRDEEGLQGELTGDLDATQHNKVDKNDPRSRLHYIKYMKKEGKSLKMWECGMCGKEFRHQYTLLRHLPTHTDERNYKCEDCGKAFRQMSTLSQHRAIHSDARPYVCECCKKTFNRVSTLISHRKTHSELKPHKCPMCFKGFHQKGNLRNHVFTHTNERPYKCDICEKGFNQMSNLVCHRAHVHGDKSRHVCRICGQEFLRRYALRLHEEYKHGIQYRAGGRTPKDEDGSPPSRKQQREDKNLRIVHLPDGVRTLTDAKTKTKTLTLTPAIKPKFTDNSSKFLKGETKISTSGVVIDPIETKAMRNAKEAGQTPFALLKPAKGIPVLVKVMPAPNNKQMLVPATVDDLRSAGKITVSPNYDATNNGNPVKAVQIKVPVVATVIQRVGPNGQLTISVESPGPEQTQDVTSGSASSEHAYNIKGEIKSGNNEVVQYMHEDGNALNLEESNNLDEEYLQEEGSIVSDSTYILPSEIELTQDQVEEYTVLENESNTEEMVTPELLEMASKGQIQLIRTLESGSYEVLSQEEAAQLIQNPDQNIEILEDNPPVQFQEILEEGEDGELVVNQSNFSALVDAMRSAGYQVLEAPEDGALVADGAEANEESNVLIESSDGNAYKNLEVGEM